MKVFKAK